MNNKVRYTAKVLCVWKIDVPGIDGVAKTVDVGLAKKDLLEIEEVSGEDLKLDELDESENPYLELSRGQFDAIEAFLAEEIMENPALENDRTPDYVFFTDLVNGDANE